MKTYVCDICGKSAPIDESAGFPKSVTVIAAVTRVVELDVCRPCWRSSAVNVGAALAQALPSGVSLQHRTEPKAR